MEIRTLESVPHDVLLSAFTAAFADYMVELDIDGKRLAEMHRRRGVRLDLSVGAFEGGSLVGFTFNGFDVWEGEPSGYDAGTGVVPAARGRGLSATLMKSSLEILRNQGATRYVLEVIRGNEPAFAVYRRIGFTVDRELVCWELDQVASRRRPSVAIETRSTIPAASGAAPMQDWTPSWQNCSASVERARETRTVLCALERGNLLGYAVVFASGDLAQFGVSRTARRRGIGTALLAAARDLSGGPLRIINTDARDDGTSSFLKSVGAVETVRQHEMSRSIPKAQFEIPG